MVLDTHAVLLFVHVLIELLFMEFVFQGATPFFWRWFDTITHGLPYDYRSVTHHSASQFARGSQLVIVPENDSIPADILGSGNDQFPSEYDALHINLVYCGGKHWKMYWILKGQHTRGDLKHKLLE